VGPHNLIASTFITIIDGEKSGCNMEMENSMTSRLVVPKCLRM
jgi:hypothetical protein